MIQGKEHVPTEETRRFVQDATRAGIKQVIIGKRIGINSATTLRKHYEFDIALAFLKMGNKALKCLEDAIESGSIQAAQFILSTQCGYSAQQKVDLTTDIEPVSNISRDVLSLLSTEQLLSLKAKSEEGDKTEEEKEKENFERS